MSRSKKKRLTHVEAWQKAFEAVDHQPLLERVGVQLGDEELRHALTHRSFANEHGTLPNNERLEFLGDAVLGLTVATKLFELYPSRPESDLSPMRASIVSRYGLADVAREINLGAHILLGRGEELGGGRNKSSILADTTEALFGAIYLAHGFEPTRDVILDLFAEKLNNATAASAHRDWKTSLQERLAGLGAQVAEYVCTSSGPDHQKRFRCEVRSGDVVLGHGKGSSKKLAEQEAASKALGFLHDHPERVAGNAEGA